MNNALDAQKKKNYENAIAFIKLTFLSLIVYSLMEVTLIICA